MIQEGLAFKIWYEKHFLDLRSHSKSYRSSLAKMVPVVTEADAGKGRFNAVTVPTISFE